MLSTSLARLDIGGQTIDVTTPKPLPVGSTLTLRAEWQNGQLRLTSQLPTQGQTPAALPSSGRQALPNNLAGPVGLALAKIQTLTLEAIMSGRITMPPTTVPGGPPMPAAAPPQSAMSQAALQTARQAGAEIFAQRGSALPAGAAPQASAAQPPSPEAARPQPHPANAPPGQQPQNPAAPLTGADGRPGAASAGERASQHMQAAGAASTAAGGEAARPERLVSYALELPLYIPGSEAPLRLHISRDDHAEEQSERRERSPSWMVRFASEAGQLGMIHAAISLIDGHVGVHLWAERDNTADWFQQNAPQLREALQASNLKLDSVRVARGKPLEER